MSWQGPPDTARTWPGAHLPPGSHPRDTTYNSFGVPQYPPGTTCKMLDEPEPYFPLTWHFWVLGVLAIVLYLLWPIYVVKHLTRNSISGNQKAYETNYDKFREMDKSRVSDEGAKAKSEGS
ncbi:hypothetical protein SVAN01_06891 [Stagonosporopsis vannaccii]|nr:hypothetical protein SVAN01_06891 [Stagonosporopsis vannaccii]